MPEDMSSEEDQELRRLQRRAYGADAAPLTPAEADRLLLLLGKGGRAAADDAGPPAETAEAHGEGAEEPVTVADGDGDAAVDVDAESDPAVPDSSSALPRPAPATGRRTVRTIAAAAVTGVVGVALGFGISTMTHAARVDDRLSDARASAAQTFGQQAGYDPDSLTHLGSLHAVEVWLATTDGGQQRCVVSTGPDAGTPGTLLGCVRGSSLDAVPVSSPDGSHVRFLVRFEGTTATLDAIQQYPDAFPMQSAPPPAAVTAVVRPAASQRLGSEARFVARIGRTAVWASDGEPRCVLMTNMASDPEEVGVSEPRCLGAGETTVDLVPSGPLPDVVVDPVSGTVVANMADLDGQGLSVEWPADGTPELVTRPAVG